MIHSVRWTLPKIEQRLRLIEPLVYRRQAVLPPFRARALSDDEALKMVGRDADTRDWQVLEPLRHWGRPATNYVLRGSFQIPPDWMPDLPCALFLPLGEAGDFSHPEGLIYVDGEAYATTDRHHQEVLLRGNWRDGKSHTLALTLWTGLGSPDLLAVLARTLHPTDDFADLMPSPLLMQECKVVQIDQPTRDFIATVRVTVEAVKVMTENDPARGRLLYALDTAFKLLETREPFGEEFYASVAPAHTALREGIAQAGPPLAVQVSAIGHAHIDVAWLWSLEQTRLKAARTFHTVLRLMEQFPDYHFTQSQPQLYEFVRQDHPALFAAIQQRVAEGRWEATGGMWVEADCNLSGAESLARQFLLGRTFFAEHFGPGHDTPVLWLPDVFGYAWALPQLIKQAGLEYFFTIKISWNQYNRLPYDSFWWQGLDGTRVLAHFGTTRDANWPGFTSVYNATATPAEVLGTWTSFTQKDLGRGELTPPLMMAYGYGDGGGGPTREMLENIREMHNFPSLPQVQPGRVVDFFRDLEATFGETLPTWNAELYFELHRGTYTTQGRNKHANRRSEFGLHDAEYLAAQAALLDPHYEYPHALFQEAWQLVCLNQFHDIIPGSSINQVYKESLQHYEEIQHIVQKTCASALQSLARHLDGHLLVVNPTSFPRDDLAFWQGEVPAGWHLVDRQTGELVHAQRSAGGTWLALPPRRPFSLTALQALPGEPAVFVSELVVGPTLLENGYVRVEFNEDGDITRIFDKTGGREVLPPNALANQLQAFEDRPQNWDAWDIDIFYDDKMWTAEPATSIRVVEQGGLRATLEVERQILHSRYTQRFSLMYNSPRLDITTHIDWREHHILLKAAFPVDILSPTATYEIQWGNVQRPTHRNTSWDWARFETCAQKWVDLSEGDYGVSLLNDGKYGHDIHENVMRISLLRGPTAPDPLADQGQHTFTYSVLPHTGIWDERVIGAAYALNDPLQVYQRADLDAPCSEDAAHLKPLVMAGQPNIVIETIKQAEDGQGLIVRLYESQRRRGPITLTTGFPLRAAWQTNLLEENQLELPVQGQQISFAIHPYEIVTLRLLPVV